MKKEDIVLNVITMTIVAVFTAFIVTLILTTLQIGPYAKPATRPQNVIHTQKEFTAYQFKYIGHDCLFVESKLGAAVYCFSK